MVPEPAPLDLDSIPVSVWKPVLVKLPAIEERGGAVEQFRSLRTRLFAFRDLNKLKTVMVGSGSPREGKSFIACNLAISLARHKASRVLLIDGDMRRGTLHTLLGCSRTPGLTTYLTGAASATDVMQRAQLRDDGSPLSEGLSSVTFIGCGDGGDQAADLSGSPRFQQLIDTVSASFDWIVVDSSPVNLVADGVNLANACDGVVLVVRGGVTRFEMAQRALVELKASRVLGVVLNAVETPPSVDDYYGYVSEEKPAAAPGPATQ
jgi:capsular exopolysaccharide synthesis family protein